MKIRFEVDQAEAFRRGIDVPKSIVTVEVNPSELSQADRTLIADRLNGIDVCQLFVIKGKTHKDRRIKAADHTFEALMHAIRANAEEVKTEVERMGTTGIINVGMSGYLSNIEPVPDEAQSAGSGAV